MKENSIKNEQSSIEEAIETMKHWIEYEKANKKKINKADELISIQETILSDYKRVLKINEVLLKENEELKEDRKNNNEMIALAQNEILNYMSGYEEGKKHKMTAVAQVVENQQYYIVRKQMEKYEEHIKRLQKENEEWQRAYQEEKDKQFDFINKISSNDSIPVQKVKDKIEEILNNGEYRIIFEGDAEFPDEATCIDAQKYIKLEKLQELLEGRK